MNRYPTESDESCTPRGKKVKSTKPVYLPTPKKPFFYAEAGIFILPRKAR